MVIALRLFLSESIEEDSFLMSLSIKPFMCMYCAAHCVCIYDLYVLPVSAKERGRMCKC